MNYKKITIKKEDVKTATDEILHHLLTNKINSLDAIKHYGVTRLAATIFSLRAQGYNIVTHEFKRITRYGRVTTLANYEYIEPKE